MSEPINDGAAISQAANAAWDKEHEEDKASFRHGFFAGVRWAEQQLAAQAPEPTPAAAGDVLRWTDVIPPGGENYFGGSKNTVATAFLAADTQRDSGKRNHYTCYCPLPLRLPAVVGEPVFLGQAAAAEPDLSWVKEVTHLEDGSVHLFDAHANINDNREIFSCLVSRVVLHRTGKGSEHVARNL